MQQKGSEEEKTCNGGGHPYQGFAPLWRLVMKLVSKGKRDQQSNNEPAVVEPYRDAGNAPEFNLCSQLRPCLTRLGFRLFPLFGCWERLEGRRSQFFKQG